MCTICLQFDNNTKQKGELFMESLEEALLDSWLRLCTNVSARKIMSDMPYNESRICNILYNSQQTDPDHALTATDLCRETRMLKSQMNRTLNSMEAKGLILRTRCTEDKRKVFITLNPEQSRIYKKQHLKVLCFINQLVDKIGKEKAVEALELFHQIADSAEDMII